MPYTSTDRKTASKTTSTSKTKPGTKRAAAKKKMRRRDTIIAVVAAAVICVLLIATLYLGIEKFTHFIGRYHSVAVPTDPVEEAPEWQKNVRKPESTLSATWVYGNLGFEIDAGVQVYCPVWFGARMDDDNPVLQTVGGADKEVYMTEAHAAGAHVWGTVESFDPDTSKALLTDESARESFAESLKARSDELGLDGICFDFEYMDPELKPLLTALVARTKTLLGDKTVSVCVTPIARWDVGNWYQCYDHEALGEVADYICLMSYEVNSSFRLEGAIYSNDWLEQEIREELCFVPSDKVLLGVPFYCYEYVYEDEEMNEPVSGSISAHSLSSVYKLLETGAWSDDGEPAVERMLYSDRADADGDSFKAAFVGTDGRTHVLYYDTPTSLAYKAQSMSEIYCLGGTCVWVQSYGCDELWEELYKAFS